jgi:NAD+ kinase
MERRISMDPETLFLAPFIVYKITSNQAKESAHQIIHHILDSKYSDIVIVEDISYFEPNERIVKIDFEQNTPDVCIVVGGDGTVLWANNLFGHRTRPPFLTFNLGHLGYMSIYHVEDYEEVIDELYNAKKLLICEKRCTIEASFIGGDNPYSIIALNDIIINKSGEGHMMNMKILVDDEELTNIRCDSLILSTPTGSTAYNLASGGSILHYDVDALILNSICPQSLSFRPIAFPRTITLKFFNGDNTNKTLIINDGINTVPMEGDVGLEVRLSDKYMNFILLEKCMENRVALWRKKIILQLGWNHSFQNYDSRLRSSHKKINHK